jgi:hypothetical protein
MPKGEPGALWPVEKKYNEGRLMFDRRIERGPRNMTIRTAPLEFQEDNMPA